MLPSVIMGLLDRTTLRVAVTVLFLAAVLAFLWAARKTLLIFLFAMLFAYLLEPLVSWFQRRMRNRRGLAIGVVYIIMFGLLATIGAAAGPRIVDEGRKLAGLAPDLYQRVSSGRIIQQVGQQRGWSVETQERLQSFLNGHRAQVLDAVQSIGRRAGEIAANSFWIVLIPILAVFFLAERGRMGEGVVHLVERGRHRELLRSVLADLDDMLSHFVRAQLYIGAISAVIYIAALSAMRVPYAFILGTVAGLLEFIPLVGPLTAAALILIVSFGVHYGHLLWLIVFFALWRGASDYLIQPRVLGGRVDIHPLAMIFGVLVGGEIGGVAGVYLSVPAIATARILWKHLREYSVEEHEPVVRS
ncbi:MAG TPA: AI-2E family transporter [candidate division Zixibacteria bacterium]|nr:AI-2E family transporter [candidate division Zixibacteria bacterium]